MRLTITIKTAPTHPLKMMIALVLLATMLLFMPKFSTGVAMDAPPSPTEAGKGRTPPSGEQLQGLMREMSPHNGMTMSPSDLSPSGGVMSGMPHPDNPVPTQRQWQTHDDQVFLSMMIVHHEAAVEMAQAEANTGQNAHMIKMAHTIISAQDSEIKLMRTMLAKSGGLDQAAHDRMKREMDQMSHSRADANPDANFAITMIRHHAGAVQMSLPALALSKNPQIRHLAEQIIIAQTKEIAQFRQWLQEKGGETR